MNTQYKHSEAKRKRNRNEYFKGTSGVVFWRIQCDDREADVVC